MRARWLVVILFAILTACQPAQQALPTLMPTGPAEGATPTQEKLPTAAPTFTARPTDDLAAMEATGEAISAPIQKALAGFPDFQGVRSVSVLMLDTGASINIDANVAPADDNEDTMGRVLTAVQAQVDRISQIRVNTFNNEIPQTLWLWEAGAWTSARVGSS